MARKAAWEEMAEADLGPYGKSRGTRWGRVFFGLFFVATATFVAAYYVPLYRTHQRLDAQYRELGQRAQTLGDSVAKAQLDLKSMTEQRDHLQAEQDQRESVQKGEREKLEHLRTALASALDKFAKKGSAAVVVNGNSLYVALDGNLVFLPQKLDVTPAARAVLCDVAKASEVKSIAVRGSLAEGSVVPAALAKIYPGPIDFSAARAAAVAQVLQGGCAVPAAKLSATGNGTRDPLAAQLGALKPG
ncbi:MAG: OmpH family outer membrane protein, partial [Polyangiaceae bacterium]